MSRRLWSGVGLSKPRKKSEEKIQTWAPSASVKAAINRGEKLYRAYLKRLAEEYREGRKS